MHSKSTKFLAVVNNNLYHDCGYKLYFKDNVYICNYCVADVKPDKIIKMYNNEIKRLTKKYQKAEDLIEILVSITINAIDPKDFSKIRKQAWKWLE